MDPTSSTAVPGSEYNYKLTNAEITNFIKMRASNDAIFTGKRNSAMPAWRAIRKELGLQRKLSTRQLKRKWENYKRKYIACKAWNGQENHVNPSSWPWFNLMDQAITGHLAGTACILNPSLFNMDDDDDDERPSPRKKKKKVFPSPEATHGCEENVFEFWANTRHGMDVDTVNTEQNDSIIYISNATECIRGSTVECEDVVQEEELRQTVNETIQLENKKRLLGCASNTSEDSGSVLVSQYTEVDNKDSINVNSGTSLHKRELAELDQQKAELEKEREMMEREQVDIDRERLILERERGVLNREKAAVDRDRITLENSRASIDKERALLERDRAVLDRDRALVERDRAELFKENGYLMQCKIARSNGSTNTELDPNRFERRERLIALFEKLVDKL